MAFMGLTDLRQGQVLVGPLFNEPMRVETVTANGAGSWSAGLVGQSSEQFRKVTLTAVASGLGCVETPGERRHRVVEVGEAR